MRERVCAHRSAGALVGAGSADDGVHGVVLVVCAAGVDELSVFESDGSEEDGLRKVAIATASCRDAVAGWGGSQLSWKPSPGEIAFEPLLVAWKCT